MKLSVIATNSNMVAKIWLQVSWFAWHLANSFFGMTENIKTVNVREPFSSPVKYYLNLSAYSLRNCLINSFAFGYTIPDGLLGIHRIAFASYLTLIPSDNLADIGSSVRNPSLLLPQ